MARERVVAAALAKSVTQRSLAVGWAADADGIFKMENHVEVFGLNMQAVSELSMRCQRLQKKQVFWWGRE